jgi:hypothetical protein
MSCLLVRVNPSLPTSLDGVSIHEPGGAPFAGARVTSGTVMCFVEDSANTAVKGFQLVLDSCGSCSVVAGPNPPIPKALYLSFSPSIGSSDMLLLNAVAAGKTYRAALDPATIQGGRPIIRNAFDLPLLLVMVAVGATVIGYLAWRLKPGLERVFRAVFGPVFRSR